MNLNTQYCINLRQIIIKKLLNMNRKLTREELEKWAKSLDEENAPYSSQIQAENSFFVSQLQERPGEELEDIRMQSVCLCFSVEVQGPYGREGGRPRTVML